jgi:hypothetical protein
LQRHAREAPPARVDMRGPNAAYARLGRGGEIGSSGRRSQEYDSDRGDR